MTELSSIHRFWVHSRDARAVLQNPSVEAVEFTIIRDDDTPLGIISTNDQLYFNEFSCQTPHLHYYYKDVSPGYKWRLGLSTNTIRDEHTLLFHFCKNDVPYEYDSYSDEFVIGLAHVTSITQDAKLKLKPMQPPDQDDESDDENE